MTPIVAVVMQTQAQTSWIVIAFSLVCVYGVLLLSADVSAVRRRLATVALALILGALLYVRFSMAEPRTPAPLPSKVAPTVYVQPFYLPCTDWGCLIDTIFW